MAISKKEIEALNCSDQLKRRMLKSRECCVTFANTDLLPTECTWFFSISEMERIVADIAKAYLGDREVNQTSIQVEYAKNGSAAPMAYVWLRKDSQHLIDKSLQAPSSGVTVTGSKYSKALIELADLYAAEYDLHNNFIPRNKRVDIRDQDMRSRRGQESNIVALALDLQKILERLLDVTNTGFKEVYGDDAPAKATKLLIAAKRKNIRKMDSDGYERKGQLLGFRVTKTYNADMDRSDEKPIPAFRDVNFAKNGYEEEDPFRRERRGI